MAVDTRDKRSSAINVSIPWRGLLPLSDSTINAPDRGHTMFLYMGLIAVVAAGSGACANTLIPLLE